MNDVPGTPPTCVVCRAKEARIGALCETCRDEIVAPFGLVPQQILVTAVHPTGDGLIDQWGRAHALEERSLIGRTLEGPGLCILHASVSRHHAHLARDGGRWRIRDLASANGTFVNERKIDTARIEHGDRVAIGGIRFHVAMGVDGAAIATARWSANSVPAVPQVADTGGRETTDGGLAAGELRIAETLDGGGVLQVGSIAVPLSANQLRLIALLARRMLAEAHQPALVRGFVRGSELVGTLPWDSDTPGDNHVKQLVRRTRRHLVRAGLGDLIESRQRFGYRLRVIPRA